MIDVISYLESKGLAPRHASGSNVNVSCVFCQEDPGKRGRLYISLGPPEEEAGLFLCHLCGTKGNIVTLKRHFGDPIEQKEEEDSAVRSLILEEAARYYHECLGDNIEALKWLKHERGLTRETIIEHRIGWADGNLYRHLRDQGFATRDIKNTGLIHEDRINQTLVDFLRGVVTIPYHSAGNCVMVRGKEIGGKYLTPPGQKTRLYNSDCTWGAEEVVVTEGELDALVVSQLGFATVGVPGANTWQNHWDDYFIDAKRVYLVFDNDEAGKTGAAKVQSRLGHKARVVEMPEAEPGHPKNDPSEWIGKQSHSRDEFVDLLKSSFGALLISVDAAYEEWKLVQGLPGLKFGYPLLDEVITPGLLPNQVAVVLAKTNVGKSLPIWSTLPTPSGYLKMGDLKQGDEVFGSDGNPTKVVGVYDRGVLPTYWMTFSDGTKVPCGPDHIWRVRYRYGHERKFLGEKDLTTQEILESGLRCGHKDREYKYIIPMCQPVQYPEKKLPIEPYALGSLIANGHLYAPGKRVTLTTPDQSVVDRVANNYEARLINRKTPACPAYTIEVAGLIRDLELNVRSLQKFIPEGYLLGSVEQRIALLQGLMDGDGCAILSQNGRSVLYSTGSRRLAEDMVCLVTSLGGTATQRWFDRDGKDEGELSIMLPSEIQPFSSSRKLKEWDERDRSYQTEPRRAIASIEVEGEDEHRCIAVDAPDSLYLTGREHVVTHNTIMLLNMFQNICMAQPDARILFVSLEQTRGDWFERALRIFAFHNQDLVEFEKETLEYWRDRIMIVDKNRVSEEQLVTCIDDYEHLTGAKPSLVAVDYLGYWSASFDGKDRYHQVSNAIMSLKAVSKEKMVPIITPHQVNRIAEFGKEPELDAARDSGAVEETADLAMMMWSPDNMKGKPAEEFEYEIHLKIGKTRSGGKGSLIKFQFAPVSLAIVPNTDRLATMAKRERQFTNENYRQLIYRHRTGVYAGEVDLEALSA